jgi:LmbE family N-acetylglucosaminyl deacetylase
VWGTAPGEAAEAAEAVHDGPVPTIVFVHAHPDDEASLTAGSMARAADAGDRVVLVFATHGDHGEAPPDLAEGESVVDRRRREARISADVLGVAAVRWLGYSDSGMTGWAQNHDPQALHNADVDAAAARLVAVLDDEDADVVVGYDWHGGYGHPDHVAVHRITRRAAERAARRPRLLEATLNRDALRGLLTAARAAGADVGDWDPDSPADDGNPIGTPEAELHWRVDVAAYLDRKRAALAAHASQTTDVGQMLAIPPEAFAAIFGTEYYLEPGREPGIRDGWILENRAHPHA